jgi:hypothetical protein
MRQSRNATIPLNSQFLLAQSFQNCSTRNRYDTQELARGALLDRVTLTTGSVLSSSEAPDDRLANGMIGCGRTKTAHALSAANSHYQHVSQQERGFAGTSSLGLGQPRS